MSMRRMLRNYKAYASNFNVLLILLMINGSEQGTEHSSSSTSAESTSSASSDDISEDNIASECGYAKFASHTLTEEARMLLYGKKIDSKLANSHSSFSDSSEVCLPKDSNAKPSDEPEMHCYRLGPTGKLPTKNVTYTIKGYSKKIDQSNVDDIIAKSFKAWSDVAPLTFTKVNSGRATINISFPTNLGPMIMGRGAYPNAQGTLVFNDDMPWVVDHTRTRGVSLQQVATHEIGHSLGLDHSANQGAIMFPSYPPKGPTEVKLGKDDIAGIQKLYGRPANYSGPTDLDSYKPDAPRNTYAQQPPTRSWRPTPQGNVYWPPGRQRGRDMTYMWGRGGGRPYYFGGRGQRQGWYPYR